MAKDKLVDKGVKRIEWARTHMKVLGKIRDGMVKERVFEGMKVGMALHTEAKTAVLALTIQEAGAEVRLTSCNPLSTDDSVAQALDKEYGLETYAKKGQTTKDYYDSLNKVLDIKPDYVIDDGADLIFPLHTKRKELLSKVKGANEETTTGIMRLRAMAQEGALKFPVMSVNDAYMKYLFDNRYGTGQSTMDGLMTFTNLVIAGKTFVVAGYGWCGRGIAMRAKGMGADVTVCEVEPIRAIEAKLDGLIAEARANPDVIVFIDEIDALVGEGEARPGGLDVAELLKPPLARGELRCIGAATLEACRRVVERAGLERPFEKVLVDEPCREETLEMLRGLRPTLERRLGVSLPDETLAAAVDLSVRFETDRKLPEKAIDLVDKAAARTRLPTPGPRRPPAAAGEEAPEDPPVTPVMVARVLAETRRLPLDLVAEALDSGIGSRLLSLEGFLRERVIGQEEAIARVSRRLRLALAPGWTSPLPAS